MQGVAISRDGAAGLARAALSKPQISAEALQGLAELCRRAGALEEVGALFNRLGQDRTTDSYSAALKAVFEGGPVDVDNTMASTPAALVRQLDFLEESVGDQIKALANAGIKDFVSSEIHDPSYAGVDGSTRSSKVMVDIEAMRQIFMPIVKSYLLERNVASSLGLSRASLKRYELQCTCHGDGAFFKAHADAAKSVNMGRAMSFVYYFYNEPQQFTGGDLLLFDATGDAPGYLPIKFTRVTPLQNSIVFFCSESVHEVEPVSTQSGDEGQGRFTLNGWFHF